MLVLATGCTKDKAAPTVPELRETNEVAALQVPSLPVLLDLRTYDGSGQSVHPDYAAPAAPWRRRYFYLALTPYPSGTSTHENPSLYASLDGVKWKAAPNAPMPLARPQEGHLSDPDVVHAPVRNELLLYYRQAGRSDRIFLTRSVDGSRWTPRQPLFDAPRNSALSPSVVRVRAGDWRMWSINAGTGCNDSTTSVELRRSANGVDWSAPESVTMPSPAGQFAWHIDVAWIPSRAEFWALFPVKAPGTCATTAVFLATSPDGVTWRTLPSAVMTAGAIPEFADVVYRSTFAYDAPRDMVTLWFSGARRRDGVYTWRTAAQTRTRAELFASAARTPVTKLPTARRSVRATFTPP
ncbi:MAG: hypothetical protein HY944_08445 [Gemmatimonadetes bacterium]|nr:hypothetical protein [Gemmatimonadota bacterium]